ncbi:hypothetical protein BDW22DRAFT_1429603 [Trametopsis cervina]|nr:hypothetical protein BDW22DRAFT_1429603 [Trametopsis cervina]
MTDCFNPHVFAGIMVESGLDSESSSMSPLTPGTPAGTHSTTSPPVPSPYLPTIEVSSTFSLDAGLDPSAPDIVISSSDQVYFFLHSRRLYAASSNRFGGLLPLGLQPTCLEPFICLVNDRAEVLNVVLHCLYEISCDAYRPSLACLAAAVSAQHTYGLDAQRYLARGAPLYDTVLLHAPCSPMETFALAAAHACEELAVAASAYTLHIPLHLLPSAVVHTIGTLYLQRLLRLHSMRIDALKRLLNAPLYPHIAKPYCSAEQRQIVARAFQLACAQVYYTATPALARTGIESGMASLIEAIKCRDCRESLESHIKHLVTEWILADCTI